MDAFGDFGMTDIFIVVDQALGVPAERRLPLATPCVAPVQLPQHRETPTPSRVGDLGLRLRVYSHAGRSENPTIVLAARLWTSS